MARTFCADPASLELARQTLRTATSLQEFKQAQTVVLPVDYALSLAQTAQATGLSQSWSSKLRNAFFKGRRVGCNEQRIRPGGRKRENLSVEDELVFLQPYLQQAAAGGILVVSQIHQDLQARLGRKVALSSVYKLLHRHGWRKMVPDKRHPQVDVQAQEEFKKTLHKPLHKQ